MQVVLVMFRSDGERRSFSVVRNLTVIGRREDCDLRIPVGEVSRKHCRLVRTDDGIRIEDLGSSNGTWVNSQRIQEMDLSPGDVVTVGPVQFVVQVDGVPADDQLTAPAPLNGPAIDDDDSLMGYTPPPAAHEESIDGLTMDESPTPQATTDEEFQIEESPAAAVQSNTDEISLEPPAGEAPPVDDDFAFADELGSSVPEAIGESELAEAPAAETEMAEDDDIEIITTTEPALEIEEDLKLPAFPATVTEAEDEFEIPDLEAGLDPAAPAPKQAAGDAADSDWDFEIEETDVEKASPDFNIDLDSSHPQPHK